MDYLIKNTSNGDTKQLFENQDLFCKTLTCNDASLNGTLSILGNILANEVITDSIVCPQYYNSPDVQAPVNTLYGIKTFKDGVSINGPAPYNGTCATVNGSLSINIGQLIINANSNVTGTITGPYFKSDNNIFLSLESSSSGTGYLNIFLLSRNNGSFTYAIVNTSGSNFSNNQIFTILFSAF